MSNKNGSKWITPERRYGNYIAKPQCAYCGVDILSILLQGRTDLVTLDHIESRESCLLKYGKIINANYNLVSTCLSCNSAKQELPVQTFIASDPVKYAGAYARLAHAATAHVDIKAGATLRGQVKAIKASKDALRAA